MTDDIVKRLDDNVARYQAMNQTGTLLSDARAEIERLRASNTALIDAGRDALDHMCRADAPDNAYTDAVDRLDAALTSASR